MARSTFVGTARESVPDAKSERAVVQTVLPSQGTESRCSPSAPER